MSVMKLKIERLLLLTFWWNFSIYNEYKKFIYVHNMYLLIHYFAKTLLEN